MRIVTGVAQAELGSGGAYASAGIAGLVELNAITLSLADLSGDGLNPAHAALALSFAMGSSMMSKTLIAGVVGGRRLGLLVLGILAPAGIAAIAAASAQLLWL